MDVKGVLFMKTKLLILLFLTLTIFIVNPLQAQWTQTSGPTGGKVKNIFDNGSTVFAAIYGSGIYKSSDNGNSWTKIEGFPFLQYCESLAGNGNELFVFNDSYEVYRSTNAGNTWDKITDTTITARFTGSFFINPPNIFAATSTGLLHSTDDGTTWSKINDSLFTTDIYFVKGVNNVVFVGNSNGELIRSKDNGSTWTRLKNGSIVLTSYSIFIKDTTLFAVNSSTSSTVLISTDYGDTWTSKDANINNKGSFYSIYSNSSNIIGRFPDNTFYISSNNGNSWSETQVDSTMNIFVDIEGNGSNVFIGTYGNGIYSSTDGGFSWSLSNTGMIASTVNSIVVRGTDVFAGTEGGIFKTTDNGTSWQKFNSNINNSKIENIKVIGNNDYAVTPDGVYMLDTINDVWEKSFSIKNNTFTAMVKNDSVIYAGINYSGMVKSTDNGVTWDTINTGLKNSSGNIPNIKVLTLMGNNVFAGTDLDGVYRTTNGGSSWSQINKGLTDLITYQISVKDSDVYVATDDGLYKSTDMGDNWKPIYNSFVYSFLFYDGGIFIANYNDIEESFDGGQTWKDVSDGYGASDIYSLAINDQYMFAASFAGGVWKRPLSEIITSVKNTTENTPENFSLGQNYPNPFNPSTRISYSIPAAGNVQLTVFNSLGQKVAELVDKFQQAGKHNIEFNPTNLSSGIYFYRLKAGNYAKTRKMIFLK